MGWMWSAYQITQPSSSMSAESYHAGLSYSDFSHMVSQFIGSRAVTLKDIMDLRKYLVTEITMATRDLEDWIQEEQGGFSKPSLLPKQSPFMMSPVQGRL